MAKWTENLSMIFKAQKKRYIHVIRAR